MPDDDAVSLRTVDAFSRAIGEAIEETLRVYPKAKVRDVITSLLQQVRNIGADHGLTVGQVGNAWLSMNYGMVN